MTTHKKGPSLASKSTSLRDHNHKKAITVWLLPEEHAAIHALAEAERRGIADQLIHLALSHPKSRQGITNS